MKNLTKGRLTKQKINHLIRLWLSFWTAPTPDHAVCIVKNLNKAIGYFTKGRTLDIGQLTVNEYHTLLSSFNDMAADPNSLKNFLYEAEIPFTQLA